MYRNDNPTTKIEISALFYSLEQFTDEIAN